MSAVMTKEEFSPEDLLAMPDSERFELVNGVLVERHMGLLWEWIAGRLHFHLTAFCEIHSLGWVIMGGDAGYQGFPGSPKTVRKPDVSFVRYGRFPGEELPTGYARLIPDLAAEVISPNDLYEEVDQKIEEYLRAGVRLVWVISPRNYTVRVYRLNGSSHSLRENDELDGEDVLPNFRCRVRNLFPRPPAPSSGNGSGEPSTAGQ
jgi:Uma2 family endonuclease